MEALLEALLQFVSELLLQAIFEIIAEVGYRQFKLTFERQRYPLLSAFGIVLSGCVAGGISLWLFPHGFIHNPIFRLINLIVTPLLAGLMMVFIGEQRKKRGQFLVAIDRFNYAVIFAFSMAFVRLSFAI